EALDSLNIEEVYDFKLINSYKAEEIPYAFLSLMPQFLKLAIKEGKSEELLNNLKQNPDALRRFNNKLVVMLSDRGQEVINAYLEGDEAELERRRYYNSNNNGYEKYPDMFAVALKLSKPGSDLSRILELKKYYFTGVSARLKIPLVKDPTGLINEALASQLKAYAMEENAAYIQNELGVLYFAKNKLDKAGNFFKRATQLAPKWSIPWSNLSELYLVEKKQEKALDAVEHAIELQPGFQGSYINKGLIYEKKNNLLLAEEFFRKSIVLNSRHYLPFERLAYLYMTTTDYALADSFFYEADKRKKGFYFQNPRHILMPKMLDEELHLPEICAFDIKDVEKNQVLGNFTWGITAWYNGDTALAESRFRKTIALDRTNPIAYHYLGNLLYHQKRWKEADIMLNHAVTYYLDREAFEKHVQDLVSKIVETPSTQCFKAMYVNSYYDAIIDHYLLGTLYEQWGHFTKAENHYRIIMAADSSVGGYQKLWMMFENTGRYNDAENVLREFVTLDKANGNRALNAFYKRMIERFPADRMVYYKAGSFLYDLVSENPSTFKNDLKEFRPDEEEEKFVRPFEVPYFKKYFKLPGLNEQLDLAPPIVHPFSDAVRFLKVADSLFDADELLAEINQKIGDLLVWQGIGEKAIPYYKKSVLLQPGNANTRMKLVETNVYAYLLSDALAQLDSLNNRGQINFAMQALLAKFCMHASRFADAGNLLASAAKVYPYPDAGIMELQGRLHTLRHEPKEAALVYKQLQVLQPSDAATMYSIARSYALMKNENEALQWLQRSIDKGFNYSWVLNADDSWKPYRSHGSWKAVANKLIAKVYEEDNVESLNR
ncbi:MAG TPA: tetratricopeptide repeat protein, partial [Ferruginibacter sp.]|nr:tetratricopeptide repeat protein [Ferruginibacter sp.]